MNAAEWLKPQLPASLVELHENARNPGFSLFDIRCAARELGVIAERRNGVEFWLLPGQAISSQPEADTLEATVASIMNAGRIRKVPT